MRRKRSGLTTWITVRLFRSGARGDMNLVVHDRILTVANGMTLTRLLALPLFVYLAACRHAWGLAFGLLWTLAVIDCLDGYVARRLHQVTRVGIVLDPLADRATVATTTITLLVASVIPWWIGALVAAREALLVILFGGLLHRRLPIPVTRISKLATAALLFGIPSFLLNRLDPPGAAVIQGATFLVTLCGIVLSYASLVQYAAAGVRRSNHRMPTVPGRY
jgi:cardiolipin synthase (CMP-forming)